MYSTYIRSMACALALLAAGFLSCKKQTVYYGQPIVFTVFNGLDDGAVLYGNYSDAHPIIYKTAQEIAGGSSLTHIFEKPGIRARYFVLPDTLAKDQPVIDQSLNVASGKSYSLYITGNKLAAEHFLVENKLVGTLAKDSLTFLQVVNASNDQPISVNVKGAPAGSFIGSLPYKGASDFLSLPLVKALSVYDLEFRDAATGTLLVTTKVIEMLGALNSPSRYLYKNWTLVVRGKRDGTGANALTVYMISHQ
jgi:hypothetical protein